MTTKKPRITVTLEPRTYELLKSLQESGGQSMSQFVSEMLHEAEPMLERMAVLFSRVKEQQDANRARIVGGLQDVQQNLEPMLVEMLGQWDMFMADSGLEEKKKSKRPHPTNRGVTNTQPIDNKQTSKKARGVRNT